MSEWLDLRAFREGDLGALDELLGCPRVMEFSDGGPLDAEAQRKWLRAAIASVQGALGFRAIVRRADSELIGYVSLLQGEERVEAGQVELGFRLVREAWGQGYASEAVDAMVGALSGFHAVVATVDPQNGRSVRVLQKAGFRFEREVMFASYDHPDHRYILELSR